MHEDDAIGMLQGFQVHVGDAFELFRQGRKLEVVGGEQRECADSDRQVRSCCPGQRQAIVGAGATSDLVHQHQALGRGVVEYVGCLHHLHHERGAATGEIVGGTDAREHPIHGSDDSTFSGNVAAHVGQ